MKVPWLKIAQVAAEFIWDFATGKLEKKPVNEWDDRHTHIKAKAQRCAGHEKDPSCR
jgi:hypothetical protein